MASVPCQCSTGPGPVRKLAVEPGSRVAIAYVQAAGTTLTLTNTSGLSKAQAQAALAADQSLKVIPDIELQRVLDALGGFEFYEYADSSKRRGSGNRLVVSSAKEQLVLTSRNQIAKATAAFGHSLSAFLIAYNANDNYTERKISAEDLKAAGKRANRGADKKP